MHFASPRRLLPFRKRSAALVEVITDGRIEAQTEATTYGVPAPGKPFRVQLDRGDETE